MPLTPRCKKYAKGATARPEHLRSGGKNRGYKYAHDYPNHFVKQSYMPNPMRFFEPGSLGKEAPLIDRLKKTKGE